MFCRPRRSGRRPSRHCTSSAASKFASFTWNQIAADARRMAAALVRLGRQAGRSRVQVSENRYEWIVLDLAIHLARGIHVAVHSTLTGPQIAFQIINSGAKLVVVSGPEQAQKLAGRGRATSRRHSVSFRSIPATTRSAGNPIRQLAR